MTDTDTLVARLRDILQHVTPSPWSIADSNSWRRIVSDRNGSVCEPVSQPDEQDARRSQDSVVREPVWQALIYVLWNHQGRSSMIGQPIRTVLMLGPSERMPDWMVSIAQQVARAIGDPLAPPTTAAKRGEGDE